MNCLLFYLLIFDKEHIMWFNSMQFHVDKFQFAFIFT